MVVSRGAERPAESAPLPLAVRPGAPELMCIPLEEDELIGAELIGAELGMTAGLAEEKAARRPELLSSLVIWKGEEEGGEGEGQGGGEGGGRRKRGGVRRGGGEGGARMWRMQKHQSLTSPHS